MKDHKFYRAVLVRMKRLGLHLSEIDGIIYTTNEEYTHLYKRRAGGSLKKVRVL